MKHFKKIKGIKSVECLYHCISTEEYVKNYVNVGKFIEYCKECPNYNKRWSCPPYSFDVMEEFWNKYRYLHLFAFKLDLEDDLGDSVMTPEEIDQLVLRIRQQNYRMASKWILEQEQNNPNTIALDGGHCSKCKRCMRLKGLPCRFGETIRPAIDAIGGDLVKTADEIFNTPILWIENGKVPQYFLFILGLLSQEENINLRD